MLIITVMISSLINNVTLHKVLWHIIHSIITIHNYHAINRRLQHFDTIGWASGRASGL